MAPMALVAGLDWEWRRWWDLLPLMKGDDLILPPPPPPPLLQAQIALVALPSTSPSSLPPSSSLPYRTL